MKYFENIKQKVPVFLSGLMLGILLAGGFFILKLDDYFKELNFYKKIAGSFSSQHDQPANTSSEQSGTHTKKIHATPKATLSASADSLASQTSQAEEGRADSAQTYWVNDSAMAAASDDIVVKKDELLSSQNIEVFNLNPTASTAKDSLLSKISGVRDDRNSGRQYFNVEFWESPLNYKGYKLSKSKMILYGLPSQSVKVFRLDNEVYVKVDGTVYHLEYTSDFRQYDRVTDENIISRLK